jgi:anti-sigma regulatory factor (Ser/Thr protein kinase)
VVHARSSFTVEVARSAGRVWVVVTDHGGGHVTVREAAPDDIRGRGIYLLSHLAESWGVRAAVAGPGKAVWFTLLVQPSASAESSLPNTASGSASG